MVFSIAAIATLGLAGCGVVLDKRATRLEAEAEAAYPPEGQFVEVDGRRVHVVVTGSGPDLVLIHGANGSARDFTFSFVDQVKDRYRVLAFDRPGMGYTDRAGPEYGGAFNTRSESPAVQARMLQAAAAKLGADRPIVMGQSYGGAVALAWALDRPQALSALVVVSGASEPWPGEKDSIGPLYEIASSSLGGAGMVPLLTAFPPLKRIQIALEKIFIPQHSPPGYAEYIGIGLSLRREAIRANARQLNSLRPHLKAMSKHYAKISVPTEIVHGIDDQVVPIQIHADPLVKQIPNAAIARFTGIGHMAHHTAQDQVIAAIDRAAARARLR